MTGDQATYEVRCEWGERGIEAILDGCHAAVIVDVLSFTTAVEIATARGATVYPYRWKDETAKAFAAERSAELGGRRDQGYSLSPASLTSIPAGTRLVLPSPNGATLTLATGTMPTIAGCLRNASAVARAALSLGGRVAVIPAGERWPDGSLRPAIEDWLGAGAIISHLPGTHSPEAALAAATFRAALPTLEARLMDCQSGRELIGWGFSEDVLLAAAHDVSVVVPVLQDGAYATMTSLREA